MSGSSASTVSLAFTAYNKPFWSTGRRENSALDMKRQSSFPSRAVTLYKAPSLEAEVHDVFFRIVERRALHETRGLEAPDQAAVVGADRVQTAITTTGEHAVTDRVDLGLAAFVGFAAAARGTTSGRV